MWNRKSSIKHETYFTSRLIENRLDECPHIEIIVRCGEPENKVVSRENMQL